MSLFTFHEMHRSALRRCCPGPAKTTAARQRWLLVMRRLRMRPYSSVTPPNKSPITGPSAPAPKPSQLPPRREDALPVPNNLVASVPPLPTATPPLRWYRRGVPGLGFLTHLAGAYGRAQRRRPYVTQLASSLAIYLAADVSAQRMGGREYDVKRTGRNLVIGAGSSIPGYHWFLFLHRNFNYASRVLSIATKVTINQICFTPIFNTYFFGMQSFLAGDGFDAIVDRIRRAVPTSIVNSCKLWPAVTAFSFAVVPVEYRPVFAGVIAVGWQTYLSYLNRVAEDAARLAGLAAGAGAGATEQQEQQHDKSTTAAPLSP